MNLVNLYSEIQEDLKKQQKEKYIAIWDEWKKEADSEEMHSPIITWASDNSWTLVHSIGDIGAPEDLDFSVEEMSDSEGAGLLEGLEIRFTPTTWEGGIDDTE